MKSSATRVGLSTVWKLLKNRSLLRHSRWCGAGAICAALALSIAGCNGSDNVASEPDAETPSTPAAPAFTVSPTKLQIRIGAPAVLTPIGAQETVAWTSSDPTVAQVGTDGAIEALRDGNATITAASGGAVVSVAVTVYGGDPAHPQATSTALIAEALDAGQLTTEQALVYRAFAHFGDARLPSAFAGVPQGAPDHMLLAEIKERYGQLSLQAQQQLGPYFLPPLAAGSSYAGALAGASVLSVQTERQRPLAVSVNCDAADKSAFFDNVDSPSGLFRVHYLKLNDLAFDTQQRKFGELVAAVAEDVYANEVGVVGQKPVSDANQACNGGSGAVDIYLTLIKGNIDLAGQAVPYLNAASGATPAFLLLNMNHPLFALIAAGNSVPGSQPAVKSALAHELMHVLQYAMSREESVTELKWFDEGTAQWAMDLVVPTIPTGEFGAPGLEDGFQKLVASISPQRRSGSFLVSYLHSGHRKSLEANSEDNAAYSTYLYFQYLARTRGNAAVADVFTAIRNGAFAIDAVTGSSGFSGIWASFAASLWNDTVNGVSTFWNTEDGYEYSLDDVYNRAAGDMSAPEGLRTVLLTLAGKSTNAYPMLADSAKSIPPRSVAYQAFKLDDTGIKSVSIANAFAGKSSDVATQAYVKIAGTWSSLQDWSASTSKSFCLDKAEERLEELVLVFSNAATDRIVEDAQANGDLQVSVSDRCGWDAAKDFSATDNPTGPWFYGTVPLAGLDSLRLLTRPGVFNGVNFWFDATSNRSGTPTVAHSSAGFVDPNTGVTFLPGELLVHPTGYPDAAAYAIVRFTAPETGDYAVTARFTIRDVDGGTVDVYVNRRAPGEESFMMPRQLLSSGQPSASLARTEIHLEKGISLDFIVGPGYTAGVPSSNFSDDSTGLTATIERVR